MRARMDALFQKMAEIGASDLHLSVSMPPMVRKDGKMAELQPGDSPLTPESMRKLLTSIMPARNQEEFAKRSDTDFAYEIPGMAAPYFEGTVPFPLPDIDVLGGLYASKRLSVMGEIGAQYGGLSPADEKLEPYFALAEKLDIPVGVHTGLGPPGSPYDPATPNFRITLGDPRLLENVVIRHPKLRLYVMHAGWPYLAETKALMQQYPQIYADVGVIDWVMGVFLAFTIEYRYFFVWMILGIVATILQYPTRPTVDAVTWSGKSL